MVRACVKNLINSSFGNSGIIADRIGVHLKKTAFSLIPFLLTLINGLGFYDNLNFFKRGCNSSSCRKFVVIKLNSSS